MTTFLHKYKVIIMYGEIKNMDKLALQQTPRYKSKKKLKKHKKILIMTNFLHKYKVIIMYGEIKNMGRLTLHLPEKPPFHDTEIKHNSDIIMNEEEPKMCKLRDRCQNRLKIGITFKSQYMKNRYKNGKIEFKPSRQLRKTQKVKNPLKNCFMLLIKHLKEVVYMYGERIKMVRLSLVTSSGLLKTPKVKNPLKDFFMLLIKHIKELVYMYGKVKKMEILMFKGMHIMLETTSKNIGGD